ncbi:MAG: Unknown protein [uncultured Sulfurovum sp.]|uniref:Uncharacterized protein n=1 Tax=uncultured Sulfurovum sp. TaxID=269237 RepID=A0A6S6SXH0_9BACT|nr:MAG: Unknown protein [uncultured Sulfurovum sp.]
MRVFECATTNGRVFRVAISSDKEAEHGLLRIIQDSQNNSYEKIATYKEIHNRVYSLDDFKKLEETLV